MSIADPVSEAGAQTIRAIPLRHPWRWLAAGTMAVVVVMVAQSVITNTRFEWTVVGHYIFSPIILLGVLHTLQLTAIAMVIGIILGVILALQRLSENVLLRTVSAVYVTMFRGTPLLVQLLFWYNIAALYPVLHIGVPFGPTLWSASANDLITPFSAAILGLSLNEAAYMAEIVRGAMLGVDRGQREAALSLGMTRFETTRRIVLPQAMRLIIPPTGNQVINMLKATSLVSAVSLAELLYTAELIYSRTYQTIPLLIVASCWYLLITSLLTIPQSYLERRFGRGFTTKTA